MKKDTYIFHFIISPNDVGLTMIIIKNPDDQGIYNCITAALEIQEYVKHFLFVS